MGARGKVAIGGADGAPEIDAPVALEILVLGGDDGVAQNLGEVVVAGDHPALQGEGADYLAVVVVKFGDGARTIFLELGDLGKFGAVNEKHAGGGADGSNDRNEDGKGDPADEPFWPNLYVHRRRFCDEKLHTEVGAVRAGSE